jgi:hypothetical protein
MSHIASRKPKRNEAVHALMMRAQGYALIVSILSIGAFGIVTLHQLHAVERQLELQARV